LEGPLPLFHPDAQKVFHSPNTVALPDDETLVCLMALFLDV
jgi:hypothetical protein